MGWWRSMVEGVKAGGGKERAFSVVVKAPSAVSELRKKSPMPFLSPEEGLAPIPFQDVAMPLVCFGVNLHKRLLCLCHT